MDRYSRQMDKQMNGQTFRQARRKINAKKEGLTDRQTNIHTY